MRTTPRVIFILMQAFLIVRQHETLAQMTVTTWLQELKKKSPNAPLVPIQASKRKPALQVSRHSALKNLCDDRSRPDFVGSSAVGKQ